MIAPSEKHLEDYIWAHPEIFGIWGNDMPYELAGKPIYKMLWRQCPLPSGIVDLVMADYQLNLVELKRDVIDAKAVVQVMRYMSDMRDIWDYLVTDYFEKGEPHFEQLHHYDVVNGSLYDQLISGFLIGHSVKSDDLYTACSEANITILRYDFNGSRYRIVDEVDEEKQTLEQWLDRQARLKVQYLVSPIVLTLRRMLHDSLMIDARQRNRFDAVDAAKRYLDDFEGGDA